MAKKPRMYWYEPGQVWVPTNTSILSILPKEWMGSWTAKESRLYIENHCPFDEVYGVYEVRKEDLYEANNAARNISKRALGKGLGIHKLFEQDLQGVDLLITDETGDEITTIQEFRKWQLDHEAETLAVEQVAVTPDYGTRIDWVCRLNSSAWQSKRWCTRHGVEHPQPITRHVCIVDFKTSAAFYDEMGYQLAAQAYAESKSQGYYGFTRLIMRINTLKHKLYVKHYDDLRDWYVFDATRALYCQLTDWEHKYAHLPHDSQPEPASEKAAQAVCK